MNPSAIPAVIMASISFYVGLYHLLIYGRRKQHREDLTFALLCLATCLYEVFCIGLYNSSTVAEGVSWQRAQFMALALLTIAFLWFVSDDTRHKPGIVLYVFSAFFLVAFFVQLVDRSELTWLVDSPSIKEAWLPLGFKISYLTATLGPLSTLQSFIGLAACTYLVVIALRFYRRGYRREAVPLLLAMGLVYAAVFNDTAVSIGLYQFVYTIEYGYLALILLMAYSLSNRVVEAAIAKETWRASEERFRILVETSSDWVWEIDQHGIYTYASPKVSELLGYTPQEIIGKAPFDLMPPAEAQRVRALFQEFLIRPRPIERLENTVQHKDGRLVVLETSGVPFFDAHRKLLGYRGIDRDITERKQAEEALRESEQRFRLFMQHFPGLAYIKDAATRMLFANQGVQKYLNIDPTAILGKTNQEVFSAEFAKQITVDDQRIMESGASEEMEEYYAGRIWATYKFAISQTDKPALLGGFTLDITERKRTEETLQIFQYTVDQASDAVQWLNREAGFEYVNDQACRSLGYTREELLRLHLWDIDPSSSKERWDKNWENCQDGRGGGGETVETWYRRQDGSVFPVEVLSNHLWFGDRELHVVVARDITERKRAEQIVQLRLKLMEFAATHSLEELLQKTLDEVGELTNSPISFYHFVEADQRTLSLQAWSTRTLNEFCQAEGKGLHYPIDQAGVWTDCVHERRPVIHNDYPALSHRRGLPEGHAQVLRELVVPILRDDRIVAILGVGNKAQAYTEKDIEVVSYVADVAWEITERKRAEAEREKLIADLEAKNAELERFTYTVSHDLKSPLITIRGFLGFLEKDAQTGDAEQMRADMKRIVDATDKMQLLLNELLELSRIGRMMNPPEATSLATIVYEAVELVRGRLEVRWVRVDVAPDLPIVYGDRARLVEVLQNLVDNAAKFMGEQAKPQITIGQQGTDRDGKSIFFVRDNGIGIDPAYHDNVFGLFNKLDPQTEGTGIGLALVKRIVEVHGGRIWMESEGLGQGATFFFTLPGPPA